MNVRGASDEREPEDTRPNDEGRDMNISGLGGAVVGSVLGPGGAVVGGVLGTAGGSFRERLRAVKTARDSQVMVRLNKEGLRWLDDLVNCGLTTSRSEAAAFLIAEGARARADLYDKIAEQSEIIRKAREQMSRLLDDETDMASSETQG